MRILLAEADPETGYRLEKALVSRGYQVLRAAHVEDVGAILETEEAPPMAIVERELPGGGGIGVCRLLRRVRARATYVLMTTGVADGAAVRAAIAAGANDLVEKP